MSLGHRADRVVGATHAFAGGEDAGQGGGKVGAVDVDALGGGGDDSGQRGDIDDAIDAGEDLVGFEDVDDARFARG